MRSKNAVTIGGRRELFIDDFMIDSLGGGARRVQHAPRPREIVLVHDRAWEGNTSAYHTFFPDGGGVRVYYRGSQSNPRLGGGVTHQTVCMAESDDGITFRKPALGVIEFQGSTVNNIVHDGAAKHNFAPFKDSRPDCPREQRYKALGGGNNGLIPYFSAAFTGRRRRKNRSSATGNSIRKTWPSGMRNALNTAPITVISRNTIRNSRAYAILKRRPPGIFCIGPKDSGWSIPVRPSNSFTPIRCCRARAHRIFCSGYRPATCRIAARLRKAC